MYLLVLGLPRWSCLRSIKYLEAFTSNWSGNLIVSVQSVWLFSKFQSNIEARVNIATEICILFLEFISYVNVIQLIVSVEIELISHEHFTNSQH